MYRAGDMVAGFRVERHLDSGGMGDVYLVRHPRLERLDALKVLREDASADPHYVERFKREAVLAARLDHDNVLPVFDRGEAGGRQWIHMKYVDGQNAAEALRRDGPFSARRIVNVITKVASALDHAHAHGLLHRDVKPANILLGRPSVPGEPERVYLSDFGIAKGVGDAAGLTPNGRIAVTPDFAAPEQIEVRELSGRTDQYALGCVLYQLLTGTLPYPGEGEYARMNAHLTSPVPKLGLLRPGLPLAVQTVIDRALAKDPADRYDSCTAMSRALEVALRGMPADAAPAPDRTAPLPAVSAPAAAPVPEATEVVASPEPATDVVPDPARDAPQEAPAPLHPGQPWWTFVDRAAGLAAAAAALLFVVSLFPPTPRTSQSPFAGEIATGRFAVGQLPAVLLLVVAVLLQLTASGHRRRPLLYGVAAGAGAYALIDSLRAYAFTTAHATATVHTDGALPRAVLGGLVVVVAGLAIRRTPPGSRMPPGTHVPVGAVIALTGVALAAVAVGTGPQLQRSQAGAVVYGVPFPLTVGGAALLALMVWLRRRALLAAALTLILASMVASLAAADPLHYPMAVAGNVLLLVAAAVLVVGGRRAGSRPTPPGPAAYGPPPPSDPWPRQPLQQPAGPFHR